MGALIKSLEASGTIPAGITPDDVIWAAPMYHEMLDYKDKTDASVRAGAKSAQLAGDKQQLLDQARQHYDWYNFLDAYRLATAALEQ